MTKEDRELLTSWLRYIKIDDANEDGIGTIELRFKIRDGEQEMRRIFNTMSHNDFCDIAEEYASLCDGCDGFADDWRDDNCAFKIFHHFDCEGFISIKGEYRT